LKMGFIGRVATKDLPSYLPLLNLLKCLPDLKIDLDIPASD
jgi:hypothetical protein